MARRLSSRRISALIGEFERNDCARPAPEYVTWPSLLTLKTPTAAPRGSSATWTSMPASLMAAMALRFRNCRRVRK